MSKVYSKDEAGRGGERQIVELTAYRFRVPSFSEPETSYLVDLAAGYCACPHHSFTGANCKHLRLASELALTEKLRREYEAASERCARERREAGGFRCAISREASEAAEAARRAYVARLEGGIRPANARGRAA